MDATAAIIVLIFVISIFSSTGNKGYVQPSSTLSPPTPQYSQTLIPTLETPIASLASAEVGVAIEKFVLKYRKPEEATDIASSIVRHAQSFGVNPKLVAALMARESRFNPRAVSSSGAMGLGQLLPSTGKSLGVNDGFDIDENTRGTVRYMKYLLDRFKKYEQQVLLALGAYLEGPNLVEKQLGYSEHTRSYVDDIISLYYKI